MVLVYDADTGEFETLQWAPGYEVRRPRCEPASPERIEATMVRTRVPHPREVAAPLPLTLVDRDIDDFLDRL